MTQAMQMLFGSAFSTILVAPALLGHSGGAVQSTPPTMSASSAEAIREHIEEADDVADSLLRWRPGVSWSDRGTLHAPPPADPSNTLISIDRADAQKLAGYLDALAVQVPTAADTTSGLRGDLRAHLEKAQQIARELQPATAESAGSGSSALVTIDRTALERLHVELDAMRSLMPRAAVGQGSQ